MKNILVLGGAGYIGSHCCKMLAEHGYNPVTYDNLSRGHKHAIQWGPFVHADVSNETKLAATIKEYQIDGAIMLSAFIEVGESISEPLLFYKNNVANFVLALNVLKSCKALVFSSTAAVYGNPNTTPISESHTLHPINPYGRSKLMCEQILQDYAHTNKNFNYCALRYFNASGADPSGLIGEEHNPETHIIPRACLSAMGKINDFAIYGDDWPTEDGSAVRDYVHVNDLARAHILALEYLYEKKNNNVFNVGIGKGFSVHEIINAVSALTGKKLNVPVVKRREGDPAILIADNTKIKSFLGWEPEYKDVKYIVKTAYDFFLNRGII